MNINHDINDPEILKDKIQKLKKQLEDKDLDTRRISEHCNTLNKKIERLEKQLENNAFEKERICQTIASMEEKLAKLQYHSIFCQALGLIVILTGSALNSTPCNIIGGMLIAISIVRHYNSSETISQVSQEIAFL